MSCLRATITGLVVLAATGCGAGHVEAPHGANAPTGRAPHAVRGAPPAAYIEFGHPGRWMVQGSSCWTSGDSQRCVDTVPPGDLEGLPTLHVKRGSSGRVHLGFDPSSAQLSIGAHDVTAGTGRTVAFTALRDGIVVLFVDRGSDDVTYVARIVFRATRP
jgi:hypothetical protein